jgi:hypothetical protein
MRPRPPRRRPARPVADAPVAALVAGAEDLAKGWLLALIEEQPLDRASSIPVDEMARDGPAICALLVRSLASDAELERVAEGVEALPRVGELAGAGTAAEVSHAVEVLRAVLWDALLAALTDPDARLVAELADRLAVVCELVREAALRRLAGEAPAPTRPAALGDAVARARRHGSELSLLLVELEDAERMLEVEPGLARNLGTVVRGAIADAPAEVEADGSRVWVMASIGRHAAEELAAAVAGAVRASAAPHGAPLQANVGVATLGVDAADAAGLIGAAEEASLMAAARGIEVARTREPLARPDEPD